jgi:hypothetical protein
MDFLVALLAGVLVVCSCYAQRATHPAFEVASVKPALRSPVKVTRVRFQKLTRALCSCVPGLTANSR